MRRKIVDVKPIVTNIFELDDAQKAFETIEKQEGILKVLLKP
jgi:threonine dehydrogenase-like Zn-dependent dehydrogenase